MKIYLKDNSNTCFVVIKGFIWLNYCWKLNQVSPVAKVALKIDVNLLNQPCKTAEWLTDWLTDLLRHLDSLDIRKTWNTQGTQETWRTLGHWRHSGTRRAPGHSRHLGTWPLRHLSIRALERHLGTQALGHSGTRALGHLRHSGHFIWQTQPI